MTFIYVILFHGTGKKELYSVMIPIWIAWSALDEFADKSPSNFLATLTSKGPVCQIMVVGI